MFEKFNNFFNLIKEDIAERRYLQCVLKALFIGVVLFAVMALLVIIGLKIYDFVEAHWDFLFLAGGGIFTLFYIIKEHYQDKEKDRMLLWEQERKLQEEADSKMVEDNYLMLRNTFFEVVSYLADVLHVKKPSMETELDSPNHVVRKLDFLLYQFILYPLNVSSIDTKVMKQILQQEYKRRLDSKSFANIAQSIYLYEGRSMPIISIHEVTSNGAYLTVSLVLTDANYCRYIRRSASASLLQQAQQIRNLSDRDF